MEGGVEGRWVLLPVVHRSWNTWNGGGGGRGMDTSASFAPRIFIFYFLFFIYSLLWKHQSLLLQLIGYN